MFGPVRTLLLTIAACVTALPAAAQAPLPTTAFDGTYAGVSGVSTRPQQRKTAQEAECRQLLPFSRPLTRPNRGERRGFLT